MAISARKRFISVLTVLAIIFTSIIIFTGTPMQANAKGDPLIGNSAVEKPSAAGALKIETKSGKQVLCDKNGSPIQLRGMSTHGLQWYPEILNNNAFAALSKDWGCNCIRLAMYVGENGYATDPTLKDKVIEGIKLAKANDMYCIVDWHVLTPGDPNAAVYSGAENFFKEIAKAYPNDANIIYEICNEPNSNAPGVTNDVNGWKTVKAYSEKIIKTLRDAGNKNLILVGSPCWSQRVDLAADNPILDSNVAYTVHFYSGTHKPCDNANDRDNVMSNVRYALDKGLCIFASEFGTTNADGTGDCDLSDCDKWLSFLNENNISWCNWSLCNKGESSAAFKARIAGKQEATSLDPGNNKVWAVDDLTVSGEYIRARVLGIEYKPIDRTKRTYTHTAFDFNDGTTQGFKLNGDSGVKVKVSAKDKALEVTDFGTCDFSDGNFWANGRISADDATAASKVNLVGADKIKIDVYAAAPAKVSLAAVPQSAKNSWANPSKATILTPDMFIKQPDGRYMATAEISDEDAPNLKAIAKEENAALSNIILFVGSDAPAIELDNISFCGREDIPVVPDLSSPIGTAAFPSTFEDGTREGWAFDPASGVQGDLIVNAIGGTKVLSWNCEYPAEKPEDNWATAPRLILGGINTTRGENRYLTFDLYLMPKKSQVNGGMKVNLAFAPPELSYWAQGAKTYDIDFSKLSEHAYLGDNLTRYRVTFDLDDMADGKVLKADTLLRDITLVFADDNSDFSGSMAIDNVKFVKTLDEAETTPSGTNTTDTKKVANPKTGEGSKLPIAALIAVISLSALTVIAGKRKKN